MSNEMGRTMARILRDLGATLKRSRKHDVWRLPSGAIFTVPRTPSDGHALKNMQACLRRVQRRAAAAAVPRG